MSKKSAPKKGGSAGVEVVDYNECFRNNYKKACSALGIVQHPTILKILNNEDDPAASIVEICCDVEVGPGGFRALCAAIMAKGSTMQPPAYKYIKSLRFWRATALDAGAASVAELLKNGKEEVPLERIEFLDCGIGALGCYSLGQALMLGANTSLTTLKLDVNTGIGDAGVKELCKGLRTNRTLKFLSITYSHVGPSGAEALATVISSPLTGLEALDLSGNHLGSDGLQYLAQAAHHSKALRTLVLRDNGLGGGFLLSRMLQADDARDVMMASDDQFTASGVPPPSAGLVTAPLTLSQNANAVLASKQSLMSLGEALADPACPLCDVNIELNFITAEEAEVLVSYLTADNTKVQSFKVDASLPPAVFTSLWRSSAGSKAAKKGGKSKKGKKK